MRPQERASARRHLDKRLNILQNSEVLLRPPRGWIKAIREALGMTTAQLGARIGVSQPRAVAIEKGEASGSITLDSLERAAQALDCRLVYALAPRKSLESLAYDRARTLAKKQLHSTSHTMELEDQSVDEADAVAQLDMLVQKLLERSGSALWENE